MQEGDIPVLWVAMSLGVLIAGIFVGVLLAASNGLGVWFGLLFSSSLAGAVTILLFLPYLRFIRHSRVARVR